MVNNGDDARAGAYVRQPTGYRAFIPRPLPPADPPLDLTLARSSLLSDATLALGRLDAAAQLIPNPDLFVGMYVHREAVLSSQIEGTRASLTDVLVFEVEGEVELPVDVGEVVNYVGAMNHGLARLSQLPLSLNLIREIHRELMRGVRGHNRDPGEFRRTQSWVGPEGSVLATATFVPPPPHLLMEHLGNLESFMYEESHPALVRAGLIGLSTATSSRMCGCGDAGRSGWTSSFAASSRRPTRQHTARAILDLMGRHRRVLQERRASPATLRAHELLWRSPIITVPFLRCELNLTFASANGVVARLEELGILEEQTGFRRNRRFACADHLRLFIEGTEAPPDAPS